MAVKSEYKQARQLCREREARHERTVAAGRPPHNRARKHVPSSLQKPATLGLRIPSDVGGVWRLKNFN